MKTREALSRAKQYALDAYESSLGESKYLADRMLIAIGKEISDSLEHELWEPSKKKYYFSDRGAYKLTKNISLSRHCDTLEEAHMCLKTEQIQNRINSWIREENKKTGFKADWKNHSQSKYFPRFNHEKNEWVDVSSIILQQINQEACNGVSSTKLIEMLNAGMIKDVPAKMEVY